jgi:hypothetical protein
MNLEPIPDFSSIVKTHLRRGDWGNFPDVVIHADESLVKKHPLYAAAKSHDPKAAEELVFELSPLSALEKICELIGDVKPHLLAIHAVETLGRNPIPMTMAGILSELLDLPVDWNIVQINQVTHTGSDGYHRLAFPALFGGEVNHKEYFLVDDFVGQGGTLANLKGFVESHGARVIGATTLTGKAYSAKLALSEETLQALREKYGSELEQWWIDTFGYGFERLTESEARYLSRSDDAHTVSTRIVAARRKRDSGIS